MEDTNRSDIYDLAHQCNERFNQIAVRHRTQGVDVVGVLHERFRHWAGHLGVFARDAGRPKVSLDARLRYSESLRSIVLRYLGIIDENLEDIESLGNTNPDEESPESTVSQMEWSPEDELSSSLVESLQALESAVESLYRLGIAIRQSSSGNLTQRMDAFIQKKDDGMLENMVYPHLKYRLVDKIKMDARVTSTKNSQPPGAALSLCRQLAISVAFRYFGILYTRSHAEKMKTKQEPRPKAQGPESAPALEVDAAVPETNMVATTPSPARFSAQKPSAIPSHLRAIAPLSDTEPSIPDSERARRVFASSHQRPVNTAPSVISIRPMDVKYPEPPKIEPMARDQACPYCCHRFPRFKFEDKLWWERHVETDFRLYACISEECADPPQLFARFDNWKKHMDDEHTPQWTQRIHRPMSWCCDRAHDEPLWFTDEVEFQKHVECKHSEYANGLAFNMFKESCEIRRLRHPNVCPVCNCIPEKIEKTAGQDPLADTGATTKSRTGQSDVCKELIMHVADHVKQAGFLSINYIRDYDEGGEQDSRNASGAADDADDADDHRKSLDGGAWIDGEWVSADAELAAYVDPETLEVLPAPALLSYEQNWGDTCAAWDFYDVASRPIPTEVDNANEPQAQPKRRHFEVPFGRNESFVGRGSALHELLKRIPPSSNQDNCQRTAIEGPAGIGKTQIALEAAYRMHDIYTDCSVFWVPAIDDITFENAYRDIGEQLKVPGIENDIADVKNLIKAALSQESAGDWLLIIDNADDQDLLWGDTAISDHLPFSRKGSILFTTRSHEAAVRLNIPGPGIITAAEMDRNESLELLAKGLKKSQIDDFKSINTLLDFLADLPLAVKQASAYMAKTSISTSKYLSSCQSGDRGTTWLISFEHIKRDAPLAAQYLKFICFLAENNIPVSLLPPGDDELQGDEAIGILKAYAFVTKRKTSNSLDIHPLVQLAIRNWLREEGEQAIWITKVFQRLDIMFPFPRHERRKFWPHMQIAMEFREECADVDAELGILFKLGKACHILKKYKKAEQIYREILELEVKVRGREHPDKLTNMNNLAIMLEAQGKYKEAEQVRHERLEGGVPVPGQRWVA